ncbi:MAG: universal stress protein [Betaproteobacteria bacterium]|nr:universal stress protein [Betaproteobacteria bacterium]
MFKKILVATDGSALSDKAVQAAARFAAAHGATIVGLSVAEIYPFMLMPEAGAMVDLSTYEELQDKSAQQAIDRLKAIVAAANVNCETLSTRGVHPYEEIINTARDKGCDLIWMGSHGRKGLDRLLLGSRAQRVLSHSTLPVMVYR